MGIMKNFTSGKVGNIGNIAEKVPKGRIVHAAYCQPAWQYCHTTNGQPIATLLAKQNHHHNLLSDDLRQSVNVANFAIMDTNH